SQQASLSFSGLAFGEIVLEAVITPGKATKSSQDLMSDASENVPVFAYCRLMGQRKACSHIPSKLINALTLAA
ncbi:hypothetical protein, partial [Pseudomonas tussilaginis]|uniref:hypothetical protein n=1 Tax=Pseudomonas sp. 5 TaxID=1619949 RepID=UPI001C44318B